MAAGHPYLSMIMSITFPQCWAMMLFALGRFPWHLWLGIHRSYSDLSEPTLVTVCPGPRVAFVFVAHQRDRPLDVAD